MCFTSKEARNYEIELKSFYNVCNIFETETGFLNLETIIVECQI